MFFHSGKAPPSTTLPAVNYHHHFTSLSSFIIHPYITHMLPATPPTPGMETCQRLVVFVSFCLTALYSYFCFCTLSFCLELGYKRGTGLSSGRKGDTPNLFLHTHCSPSIIHAHTHSHSLIYTHTLHTNTVSTFAKQPALTPPNSVALTTPNSTLLTTSHHHAPAYHISPLPPPPPPAFTSLHLKLPTGFTCFLLYSPYSLPRPWS